MRCDGAKVRAARERKGHYRSQAEIAVKLRQMGLTGVQAPWVSAVERDLVEVPEAQATALAAALGVALTDILPPGEATGVLLARFAEELDGFAARLRDLSGMLAGSRP